MDPNLAVCVASATLFVALGTLILGLFAWLRADTRRMEERLRAEFARQDERFALQDERFARLDERLARLDDRFDRMEARLAAMEHGQAKLEGLLEGLREAIAGRVRAAE